MERGIIVVQLIKAHLLPLLFTSAIIHLLSKKRRHGLWDIPGPFLAGYTRLWRMYDVWKGQAHMTAIQLHRKYGPLVRIGPSHVSVGDPKAIPTIYGLKSGFTKVLNSQKVASGSSRISNLRCTDCFLSNSVHHVAWQAARKPLLSP